MKAKVEPAQHVNLEARFARKESQQTKIHTNHEIRMPLKWVQLAQTGARHDTRQNKTHSMVPSGTCYIKCKFYQHKQSNLSKRFASERPGRRLYQLLASSIAICLLQASIHQSFALANNDSNNNSNNNNNNHQQHQHQPAASTSKPPLANGGSLVDPSSSINLIPVDQPVVVVSGTSGSGGAGQTSSSPASSPLVAPTSGGSSMSSALVGPRSGLAPVARTSEMQHQDSEVASRSLANGGEPATAVAGSLSDSAGQLDATDQVAGRELPASTEEEFFEPGTNWGPQQQYYAAGPSGDMLEQQKESQQQQAIPGGAYVSFVQQQQQHTEQPTKSEPSAKGGPSSTRQQIVERRFGLFKKGQQHHFGQPLSSASYSAAPYLSDCERCLASLGQQQSAAEVQQLAEPALVPATPQVPQVIGPIQANNHFAGPLQHLSPLKSKLFMKFPFFVKGNLANGGSPGLDHSANFGAAHYWGPSALSVLHQQHQQHHLPTSRPAQALYIRPSQSAAYNCIQANPPLMALASNSANQAEALGPLGGGGASKTSPAKQYAQHQQQNIYSSSSY